jgi:hypothetical protein
VTTTPVHTTTAPPPPPRTTTTTTSPKPPKLRLTLSAPRSAKRGGHLRLTYTATAGASAALTLTRGHASARLWKGKVAKGRHTVTVTLSKRLSTKLVGAAVVHLTTTKPAASATAKLKVGR